MSKAVKDGKLSIGIDPGKKGAVSVIYPDGSVVSLPWEDRIFTELMHSVITTGYRCVACVEKVSAMPGQGVTSMFSFGKSAGFIEGVLCATGIPYQLVPPQKWKKEFSLGSDKAASVQACKRLFPDLSLLPTPRCHKDSDGMAEATLMAEYARRNL